MIEKKYFCNICGDRIDSGTGHGVKFFSKTQFKFVLLDDAPNHICVNCIKSVVAQWKDGKVEPLGA